MKQKRIKFLKSQIEIVEFEAEDVLTASGNFNEVPEEPGIDLPIDNF